VYSATSSFRLCVWVAVVSRAIKSNYIDKWPSPGAGQQRQSEILRLQLRLSNMKASLLTWQEFLTRVVTLWETCQRSVTDILSQRHVIHRTMTSQEAQARRDSLTQALSSCEVFRTELGALAPRYEELRGHEEELRETVSPSEMRILHQRVLLLQEMHLQCGGNPDTVGELPGRV